MTTTQQLAFDRLTVRAQNLVLRCETKAAVQRAQAHVAYMLDVAAGRDLLCALEGQHTLVG